MDDNQKHCKELYLYYRFMSRNLEIDIKAMNNSIQSPKILQKRKYRKPKKTTLNEIINEGEYKIGELSTKEKEEIDAITKHASLIDLTHKFYKMGIIIAFVYFEAFNKDIMSVFDSTENYERYNILSKDKKKRDIKKLNDTLNINLEDQFFQWKSLKDGYDLRNIIVHNNGRIDEKFTNEVLIPNGLTIEDIREIKKFTLDYEKAFEEIVLLIDIFFEFILEQIGLRVCCHCKKLFKDKPENSDFAPICQECRISSKDRI